MRSQYDYWKAYSALCSGVENGKQIMNVIKKSVRVERYIEKDKKADRYLRGKDGKIIRDENDQPIRLPALEVSLDKLYEEGWEFPSASPSAENAFFEKEFSESKLLRQCVESLPRYERQLIEEIYFKNKTQKETAQGLGKSQQSISRHIKAAIAKMKAVQILIE